ncbi:hypothetical protein THIAE_07670 [Thiomicrospira aerophila AL3]|uniref:Uncharacterized protein n=1 Tax=Thiomicrospira aerophila AL3 TaxID=717772 RepID=W0DYJ1_9GAMM|nr:hypothetical protein [Thiomicrospira aerophila]AHF02338.1 hypothetical protein THIAE_07670 [Thiomicrospira aerophila AL3]
MVDQDYLKLFDSADEQAAVEAVADELSDDFFNLEDVLLDDINSIEQNLDTEHIVEDFEKLNKAQHPSSDENDMINELAETLAALKHQQDIHQHYFAKLRKQAAPNWHPTSK